MDAHEVFVINNYYCTDFYYRMFLIPFQSLVFLRVFNILLLSVALPPANTNFKLVKELTL